MLALWNVKPIPLGFTPWNLKTIPLGPALWNVSLSCPVKYPAFGAGRINCIGVECSILIMLNGADAYSTGELGP